MVNLNIIPEFEEAERYNISVTIMYVFRANFNDTYYLDKKIIEISSLENKELVWFDPYFGRTKTNVRFAIAGFKNNNLIIYELNEKGEYIEHIQEPYMDCIFCEDYDASMLIASHVSMTLK